MKIETHYEEVNLDDIMRYYAKGFQSPDGKILSYTFTIDTNARRVIYTILLDKTPKEP